MPKKVGLTAILIAASMILVTFCSVPFLMRGYQEISLSKHVSNTKTLDEHLAAFDDGSCAVVTFLDL